MLLTPLNAGMIEVEELPQLDRDLQAIADADKACFTNVSSNNAAAVAMACAHWDDPKGRRMAAVGAVGAPRGQPRSRGGTRRGHRRLLAWSYYYKLDNRGFGRDASWTMQMPPAFWRRLTNHPDPSLRLSVIASDPQALGRDLARLVDEPGIWAEIADMIASNPRTPRCGAAPVGETQSPLANSRQDRPESAHLQDASWPNWPDHPSGRLGK